ncbi:MAG: methyltransferase [Christensenellales bacterium]|jgi:predicted RNA methylase
MDILQKLKSLSSLDGANRLKAEKEIEALGQAAVAPLWLAATQYPREALLLLSRICKKKAGRDALQRLIPSRAALHSYFSSPDAKTRKNAAILSGVLGDRRDAAALADMLEKETTLFVRPSIILSLSAMGGPDAAVALKKAQSGISKRYAGEPDSLLRAERDALSKWSAASMKGASFTGLKAVMRICLSTLDDMAKVVAMEAKEKGLHVYEQNGKAFINTRDYASLFKLRTFEKALIAVSSSGPLPSAAAESALLAGLLDILRDTHGPGPWRYRVSVIGQVRNKEFITAFCDRLSSPGLINSPSAYDVEIIVEAGARCYVYLNPSTFEDTRFSYRKAFIPAAISPVAAACAMRLILPYTGKNDILDAFCGSGTMLVERHMLRPCQSLTGVDISREAIAAARTNLAAAGIEAELIHSDILNYRPDKKYGELISNMPFGNRVGSHSGNERLYSQFVRQLPSLISGKAFLYTMEKRLLNEAVRASGHRIRERYYISSGGLQPGLFIIQPSNGDSNRQNSGQRKSRPALKQSGARRHTQSKSRQS